MSRAGRGVSVKRALVLLAIAAVSALAVWVSAPACQSRDVAVVTAILSQCCQSKGCLSYEQCRQAFAALGNLAHCSSEPDSAPALAPP